MNPPDDIWMIKVGKDKARWSNSVNMDIWDKQKWNRHKADKMMYMNKMFALGYVDTFASTSVTQFPVMGGTGQSSYTATNIAVPSSSVGDYLAFASQSPSSVTFRLKNGFRIVIAQDGSGTYEIVAPENLKVEDFVKAYPHGKLLDVDGNVIEFNPNGTLRWEMLRNVSGHVIDIKEASTTVRDSLMASSFGRIAIPAAGCRLLLPDGVELVLDEHGGYQIDDSKQTFTYKAAPRDFNRFLNASDVLEDFIRYLGSMAVRQRHVMQMPLGLFIQWLVIEAAKADGDPYEDVEPPLIEGVQAVKAQPRCQFCKRFISQTRADRGVNFCSPAHLERYLVREKLDELPRMRARRQRIAAPPSDFLLPVPMAASS